MKETKVPKIIQVTPLKNLTLLVIFENGSKKNYNVKKLFNVFPQFNDLKNLSLFQMVHIDSNGYAISWNDDLDLSRYEIWENGK